MLSTNIASSSGSQIVAGAGSTVVQSGVKLNGVINVSGTGTFQVTNSSANFLDGLNLTGALDLASYGNARERIINGATLNGAVNIANGGILSLDSASGAASQTLSGTAVINLNDAGARLAIDGTGTTTLGANITVRGQGDIGTPINSGGNNVLTNNGLISADVNGGTLNIAAPAGGGGSSFVNNGTLQAVGGGRLLLSTNILSNPGGQIVAGAGSAVIQSGVTVNGVVTASGSGVVTMSNSSANFLNGVVFTGTLDMGSNGNSRERIINGATINGAVNIANGGILSLDNTNTAGNNQTIGGSAVINLNDGGARLAVDGTGTTTLGSNVTVRGQGNIGQALNTGGNTTLVINGLVSADVSGGTLNITPPASGGGSLLVNHNILQATGGGTLQLSTNIDNTGGQIRALTGSQVVQSGVTVTGGVIASSGTGSFLVASNGGNFLSGVTVTGLVDMTTIGNSRNRIINGGTINGAVNIGSGGILSLDSTNTAGNAQTVGGTGVINLTDSTARLAIDGTGTTTLAAGLLVRGQGNIGQAVNDGGNHTLISNATILADGGTLHVTAPASGGASVLAGAGTLQTSGGTLDLNTSTASTQGQLVMGGTGSALNLNSQNLTITIDYTNAQSGTGNAFDRRAGVSGTGQILAGANAAQAITGANVSNGSSPNATLSIGNLRVGSTSYTYRIANTGTTGPILRGAIQTSVNGANITDARLSGSGVTAANYSAGAPGGNSGDQTITFTANSAGALAPLTGQVLNLRSNFDNIPDQKLNIVVAAGAGAYSIATGAAAPAPVTIVNQRVGGTQAQALTISNTAAAGSFTEALNASFGSLTGAATHNGGSIAGGLGAGGVAAGGPANTTAMSVGVDTSSAGLKSGTVTLDYQSNGAGSSGLATIASNSQTVNVSGKVYQVASGALLTAPLNFGTVQVGQNVSQVLSITNSATGASGFVEDLNARFGASSGLGAAQISGTGSIIGLAAGATNASALTVGVNTATAGTINGAIAVNYFSAGTVGGVSNGLGEVGVGSSNYGVSGVIQTVGQVINQASPLLNTPTINLGNVRIGSTSPTQFVSIGNQSVGSPQAALNASISANAPISASGSFNLLAPGATNNTSLQVGINTANAGAISGQATIALVSDASNVGGCEPNCQLTLASKTVDVTGAVYRLASPSITSGPIGLAARVGDLAPTAGIGVTNVSPDAFTERLNASIGSAPAGFVGTGSISGLVAGASSSALGVTLNTTTAGSFGGQAGVAFVSSGAGTTNAADLSVGTQNVALSGHVYAPAAAHVGTTTVDFGIVHKGDSVAARNVAVTNSAGPAALNDTLNGSLGGASGPFTAVGTIVGLAPGNTDTTSFLVGMNTANAGVFAGGASAAFASHNPELVDLPLGAVALTVKGQVNNFAELALGKVSGSGGLTHSGSTYTLDFGSVQFGSLDLGAGLAIVNGAAGPADLLSGSFTIGTGTGFTLGGFDSFAGIAAGASLAGLTVGFGTDVLGEFTQTITIAASGSNASGFLGGLGDTTLVLRGNVVAVPEPATYLLYASGMLAMWFVSRRRLRDATRR